jgi:uncharacterized Zn finger protein
MFEQLYNQSIPRLEKAFELIKTGDVVLLQYGRAVVHGTKPYHVNYTRETCECPDFVERHAKCKHIWAAQLKQQQLTQEVEQK